MNLRLKRKEFSPEGIFGELADEAGNVLAVTLEHSYECLPKLPAGSYTCLRGQHRLHSGPIETFEVTGVPGHHGILFHVGNTQVDSEGCVLVGLRRDAGMILGSKLAFEALMKLQAGAGHFELIVE